MTKLIYEKTNGHPELVNCTINYLKKFLNNEDFNYKNVLVKLE